MRTNSGERKNDSLADYIRTNRVFVLGAGFSAAAGVPLTQELLRLTMDKLRSESPGIFTRVNGCAKTCFQRDNREIDYSHVDFSGLCTFLEYMELQEYAGLQRWSERGSREKLALRFYLSKVIAQRTPPGDQIPKLYLDFAAQLHRGDIVLSFNWDCLLEAALERVGNPYTYDFGKSGIYLCKLHGSTNWHLGEPKKSKSISWLPLQLGKASGEQDVWWTKELASWEAWDFRSPLAEVEPFLVLPGYGKAHDVRSIALLWYRPEFAFAATHDIYIIGLSLSPDDFFIGSFFLDNLPYVGSYTGVPGREILIVNPDPHAPDHYDFVLADGSAKLLQEPFSVEHVRLIRDRVGHTKE